MKLNILLITILTLTALMGCKSHKQEISSEPLPVSILDKGTDTHKSQALPKAVIYKTNGDYNQNVMITLNDQRNAVLSYPAPTDVSNDPTPIEVGNGWLLDRRGGIGINSTFLKYTYSEYAKLKKTPSPRELLGDVIPDAHVTVIRVLPITANEAIAHPELVKKYTQDN